MSSCLALRLAAVEALCPSALIATGPMPTLAGNLVYDSRIDLIAGAASPEEITAALERLENRPLVVLYTEEVKWSAYSSGGHADMMTVDLVAEVMLAATGVIVQQGADGSVEQIGTLEAPATDRAREADIDMLAWQVESLLDIRLMLPSQHLLPLVQMKRIDGDSVPQRAADRSIRLGARTLRFRVQVKKERWPTAAGLLPEPLASVAAALPAGSSGRQICDRLAALTAGPPPPPPPLEGVYIVTNYRSSVAADDPDAIRGHVSTL